MTSLEQQLKKLKTPQTDDYRLQKYRSSFLYSKKEAAAVDCYTHLRIANNGLKNLVKLNPKLKSFEDLFADSSIEIDRAVLQSDENDQLSKTLRKFINNCIVPFFMLNDCHEVLEYLVYKYKIHSYQPNDLLCAILPYHETKLFSRALQLFSVFDQQLWAWLQPYKKENVPVPKERIMAVLKNKSKLPLVNLLGEKLIEINKDTPLADIYTSFYTTSIMCVLDFDLDEKFFISLMPYVYKAIKKSKNSSLFMAGLVLVGYLAYTQPLDDNYVQKLCTKMERTHAKIKEREPQKAEVLDEYLNKVLAVIKNQVEA